MTYDGIVILGAPRSGTTLLRNLLDAHPEIAVPPETFLLRACARFLDAEPFGDGLQAGVLDALSFSGIGEDEVIARLRDLAFGILGELATRRGKQIWGDKTAYNAFHIDEVETLCGDRVRYVLLVRHGLDAAVSTVDKINQMNRWISELHPYVVAEPRPLHACTRAWVDIGQRLLRLQAERPSQCHTLRYEDLVASPEEELEKLLDFLERPADTAAMLATARPAPGLGDWKTFSMSGVKTDRTGRFKGLDPTTRGDLAELANPTLEAFGYPSVEIPKRKSRARARRHLELGLLSARMKIEDPS